MNKAEATLPFLIQLGMSHCITSGTRFEGKEHRLHLCQWVVCQGELVTFFVQANVGWEILLWSFWKI